MSQTVYVSSEALAELKQELERRKFVTRREIAARLEVAKELGDLSENFEYHEAKEQQGANESRVIELESIIRNAVLVEKKIGGTIALGSTFTAEVDGAQKVFRLVGATEANPLEGKISNESPIGKAFLGKNHGDVVEVNVPSGKVNYKILRVE
ncbi:MAG: transcription elongation factor GreA [Patescibacteria group bacterium]